jgi:tetratricopeptide (TPR) repeat protein
MALRLNSDASTNGASQPSGFAERARARLRAGDLDSYRSLYDEAGRIADYHARYSARVGLVEGSFAAVDGLAPVPLARALLALAQGVAGALEDEPREPVLLNYLGVALYELGAAEPAAHLFRAALRLDPEFPNAEDNLAQARGRRGRGGPQLPKPIELALPALGKAAIRCADRAQPVDGLTMSLCMIVKDEEEMLPRCLEAAKPAVDEIVVVDTGSSDRTIEIAREFGARVIEHPWSGDFAAARNVSVDAASGDWILWLDADEVLVAEDAERLRGLTGRVWREAFFLVEINFTGELGDGHAATHSALRVFRNRPGRRFEGRVHEQIGHALPSTPERIESTSVRIEHYGYLGAVRDAREKSRRNIELLERQSAEGESTPFHSFNLGSEYLVTGDIETALRHFETAWRALPESAVGRYGFVPSLVNRIVKARRVLGDRAGARRMAEEGLELFPGYTDLVLEQGFIASEEGDFDAARQLFEQCLEMGDAPSRYSPMVGAGTFAALCALADTHRTRGDLPEAQRLLTRCLQEHPGYLGAVHPLAQAMLAGGADPREVTAVVESTVDELTPSVRFMLGTALYEAAQPAAAEEQFRHVLKRQPDSGPTRLALAEALLSQRRYEQAAAVVAGVPEEDPCAAAACRTELFAARASGNQALEPAPERTTASGLPHLDAQLFAAWLAAIEEKPLPALPADCGPLLAVLLEALLRVQEVDAFVSLLPVMDSVDLPARERHEVLAQIYLRRGFLESAADEWIAGSQEGADVRALVGLAQVALARELPDEALLFAQEALAIDPDCTGAARIANRLAQGNAQNGAQVGAEAVEYPG